MNFIKAELKLRFHSLRSLLHDADEMWEKKVFWTSIFVILCAVLCTVVGIVLLPVSLIVNAFIWYADPEGCQSVVDDVIEELDS